MIITEINREKLPLFVKASESFKYINRKVSCQAQWNTTKQSRLIESFLVNIPIPPIILYEQEYNQYELIDGRQRVDTICNFYGDELVLENLEFFIEINGKRYSDLTPTVKSQLDRRSIEVVTVIKDSLRTEQEILHLKQVIYKRVNDSFSGVMLPGIETKYFDNLIDVDIQ